MHTITIGDPAITWHTLTTQSDSKRVLRQTPFSLQNIGQITESISYVEYKHQSAFRRSQTLDAPLMGSRQAITIVARDTFAPLWHQETQGSRRLEITYEGLTISGEQIDEQGQPAAIQYTLRQPAFDAHSVELLLRLLPLADGYEAQLPVYRASHGLEDAVTVRVQGLMEVTENDAINPVWVVETDWGHLRQTYWVGESPPAIVRQITPLSAGQSLLFVR
jgi:hypothetical protein